MPSRATLTAQTLNEVDPSQFLGDLTLLILQGLQPSNALGNPGARRPRRAPDESCVNAGAPPTRKGVWRRVRALPQGWGKRSESSGWCRPHHAHTTTRLSLPGADCFVRASDSGNGRSKQLIRTRNRRRRIEDRQARGSGKSCARHRQRRRPRALHAMALAAHGAAAIVFARRSLVR